MIQYNLRLILFNKFMHIVLLMGVMEMMKSGGELISGLLYIECTLVAGGLGSALLPEEF